MGPTVLQAATICILTGCYLGCRRSHASGFRGRCARSARCCSGALLGAGEVAGRYRAAAAVAAERGEGLRVVLRIDSPALAGLPWEAMYDQAAGAYVCRQDQLESAAAPRDGRVSF
jgi:hypothetical protein